MFIAEIGLNHHGNFGHALRLIQAASDAGCDAVKFQYRSHDFYHSNNQIGDEILGPEIERTRLNPDQVVKLILFAQQLGIKAGISFFRVVDFQRNPAFSVADFYKVPSVEHLNFPLIDNLSQTEKPVFLSTGGADLENLVSALGPTRRSKIHVMHCIANYPVAPGHARLQSIKYLQGQGFASVGYSSHDTDFLTCLVAIGYGIQSLERHIVFDKHDGGLDSSSSSTPEEMALLAYMFSNFSHNLRGLVQLKPNQGEVLNMQNLGTGMYAKEDMEAGVRLKSSMFEIKAPRLGLSVGEFELLPDKRLRKPLAAGAVLSSNHFQKPTTLATSMHQKDRLEYLAEFGVGLPVRLHDWQRVKRKFNLSNYEFHLSFNEVWNPELLDLTKSVDTDDIYAIHLPDYVSKNELLNLFSQNQDVAQQSRKIVKRVMELADQIEQINGRRVRVVGSFPYTVESPENHIDQLQTYLTEVGDGRILPQWLPVHGWYFGGHAKIEAFNSLEYIDILNARKISICLDLAHLIMSANFFGACWKDWLSRLRPQVAHVHLSDATGVDCEGMGLGEGCLQGEVIRVSPGVMTVVEVWQGHLNDFEGFSLALDHISKQRMLTR